MRSSFVVALLLLAGCAPPLAGPAAPRPSATCDFRMVDHNRRACAERGGAFAEPAPGAPCGACR